MMDITSKDITKSTVDMETSSMSENDSEIEIEEENFNYNDEPLGVPEYETMPEDNE